MLNNNWFSGLVPKINSRVPGTLSSLIWLPCSPWLACGLASAEAAPVHPDSRRALRRSAPRCHRLPAIYEFDFLVRDGGLAPKRETAGRIAGLLGRIATILTFGKKQQKPAGGKR